MKINQIINEMATTAGSVATVAKPMGEMNKRPDVRGLKTIDKVMSGNQKKGPYANSINEGKVKQLAMDLKTGPDGLTDKEFKEKYGKTKQEMRKSMENKPEKETSINEGKVKQLAMDLKTGPDGLTDKEFKEKYGKTKQEIRQSMAKQPDKKPEKVEEAKLDEQDKIISPDKGTRLKPGLHGKNTANTPLSAFRPPFKSEGLWVSDSRGNSVLECVKHDLAPIVAKALNAFVVANEGVIAGGGVGEAKINEKAVSKAQQKFMGMVHATQKGEKAPSKEVAKVAKTMKKSDAEDFAKTKHKGLPQHTKKKD